MSVLWSHFWLILFSLALGVLAKYADLVNEHNMKPHFKGAGLLSGILWGISGAGIIYVSPWAGITYIAHVLYWFLKIKLEYTNHAIAGVIVILSGLYFHGYFLVNFRNDLVFVFLGYTLTGYLQSYYKRTLPHTRPFWRLRLRIYLVPFLYGLARCTWDPFVSTVVGMIACEWMTYRYREYRDDIPCSAGA
jgi:hypothetical protein